MGSIKEFVESVEWDGKDASWDALVCDTLALNDIKSLEQIGRAKVTVEKLIWEDQLSIGKRGFAEVCPRSCPACSCRALVTLVLQEVFFQYMAQYGTAEPANDAGKGTLCGPGCWCARLMLSFAGACKGIEDFAPQLQAALLGALGKPVQEVVHVDIGEKLVELGLDKFFPVEAGAPRPFPPPPALSRLAPHLHPASPLGFVWFVWFCSFALCRRGHRRMQCASWPRS